MRSPVLAGARRRSPALAGAVWRSPAPKCKSGTFGNNLTEKSLEEARARRRLRKDMKAFETILAYQIWNAMEPS